MARLRRLGLDAAQEARAAGLERDARIVTASKRRGLSALFHEYRFDEIATGWRIRQPEPGIRNSARAEADLPGTPGLVLTDEGAFVQMSQTPLGAPAGASCGYLIDERMAWAGVSETSAESHGLREIEEALVEFVANLRREATR